MVMQFQIARDRRYPPFERARARVDGFTLPHLSGSATACVVCVGSAS
jgi:hypothetical protein